MEVIVHVLVGDATVGVDEAWVHAEDRGVGEGGHGLGHKMVDLGVALAERVGPLPSGEQPEHKCAGERQLVLDDLNDGQDAATDLFCRVAMIIGAYP